MASSYYFFFFMIDFLMKIWYNSIIVWGDILDLDLYLKETGFNRNNGNNIGIAIIDTGCNIVNENIKLQYNSITGSNDVYDYVGHGTAIYEIINSIAPKANFYIMKGLDDKGNGSMLSLYECLIRCRDNDNIDIICMSFSSFNELSSTTRKAMKECLSNNKIILSSIGNDSMNVNTYPSSIDGVYSVGGLNTKLDDKFETSNFRVDTNFVALGDNIFANNEIRNGTSFANAIVVGQIAEIMSDYNIDRVNFHSYNIHNHFSRSYRELNTAYGSLYKEVLQ